MPDELDFPLLQVLDGLVLGRDHLYESVFLLVGCEAREPDLVIEGSYFGLEIAHDAVGAEYFVVFGLDEVLILLDELVDPALGVEAVGAAVGHG